MTNQEATRSDVLAVIRELQRFKYRQIDDDIKNDCDIICANLKLALEQDTMPGFNTMLMQKVESLKIR